MALLATLLLASACNRNPDDTARSGESASAAVADTMPSGSGARLQVNALAILPAGSSYTTFALTRGTCVQNVCHAELELRANGQPLDAVPLEFVSSDTNFRSNTADATFATNASFSTYTAGQEEGLATTLIQSAQLSPQRTGVLVQQAGGFEHVKRRRDLFIVDHNKLKRVWAKQDGQGPIGSYADVIQRSDGADDIVLIEGITIDPAQADQITALRLTWDEKDMSLKSSPVESLKAVVTGDFKNAEAAREQLADACLAKYWILTGNDVGEASKPFVLAMLTADSTTAALRANATDDCSRKFAPRIATFRPLHANHE